MMLLSISEGLHSSSIEGVCARARAHTHTHTARTPQLRLTCSSRWQVSREDYLPSGAEVLVDLEPHSAQVTIAMVKPEYFAGSNNKLVVLSWSGEGKAMLHVETPGEESSNVLPHALLSS